MTFSRRFLSVASGSLLLLTAGCDLHDFIHWSPDGQHAFVQGNDGTLVGGQLRRDLGPATDARAWPTDHITQSPSTTSNEDLG